MAAQGDFLVGEELGALFVALEDDLSIEDEVFLQDLDQCVTEIENDSNSESFSCSFCTTICKSKSGPTRHINIKHMEVATNNSGNSTKVKKW